MTVLITRQNNDLFMQLSGQPQYRLYAESETMFYIKEVDAKVEFVEIQNGTVDSLFIHHLGANLPASRKIE